MKKLSILTFTFLIATLTASNFSHAKFDAIKTEKNIYGEITLTLPSYTDSRGTKYFFQADHQTAEGICQYLGKQKHYEYDFKNKAGKRVVSGNSIHYRFDGKMIKRKNLKTNVINTMRCSGLDISENEVEITPNDAGQVRRALKNWAVRLRL